MFKKGLLVVLTSVLTFSTVGAVPTVYKLVTNFDGTKNTGFPQGNKPDTGDALPDCWSVVSIEAGAPSVDLTSSVTEYNSSTGEFQVSATGGQIYGNDDSFAGFSCSFTGDATVRMEVVSATQSVATSKYGFDVRNGTAPGGEHCFIGPFSTTGLITDCRATANGITETASLLTPQVTLPECLEVAVDYGVSARLSYANSGPCSSANYTVQHEFSGAWLGDDTGSGGDGSYNIIMGSTPSGTAPKTATGVFGSVSVSTSPVSHTTGTVGFSQASIDCNEDVGNCAITVTRSSSGTGALDLSLDFVNGSALAGTHFTTPTCNATVDYTAGETGNKVCNLPITDFDGTVQGDKGLTVNLTKNSGTDTLEISSLAVTVKDTDTSTSDFVEMTPTFTIQKGISGYATDWSPVITGSENWKYLIVDTLSTGTEEGSLRWALSEPCPANTICPVIRTVGGKIVFAADTGLTFTDADRKMIDFQFGPPQGLHVQRAAITFRDTEYLAIRHFSCFNGNTASQATGSCINWYGQSGMQNRWHFTMNSGALFAFDSGFNLGIRTRDWDLVHSLTAYPLMGAEKNNPQGILMGEASPVTGPNFMALRNAFLHATQRCPLFSDAGSAIIAGNVCGNFTARYLVLSGKWRNSSAGVDGVVDIVDNIFLKGPQGNALPPIRYDIGTGTGADVDVFRAGNCGHPDSGSYDDTPETNLVHYRADNYVGPDSSHEQASSIATLPDGFARSPIGSPCNTNEESYLIKLGQHLGPLPKYRLPIYQRAVDDMISMRTGVGDPGQVITFVSEVGGFPTVTSSVCNPFIANDCYPGAPALPSEATAGDADTFVNKYLTAAQAAHCAVENPGAPGC